ncbi:MAG: GNAT family N-acetyltransferase [Leptolyngbyaceae bacterium]|nr:GNAT family N-acetyltransferase [Leptolyngbyaceae bacterium]
MQKAYQGFLIRSWQPSDRQQVVDIARCVLEEYDMVLSPDSTDWDVIQVEQAYWETNGTFLVVEEGGKIVGSGAYHPCDRASKPGDQGAELRKMFLLPHVRGQGLGGYLLTLLEQTAADNGFTEMWLETSTRMQAAIKMYERHGYYQPENADIHIQRCDRIYVKSLLDDLNP